jgi:hypothetical protein
MLTTMTNETVVLDIKELIYHRDFHFTSCIETDGILWYHDGITIKISC